MAYPNWKYVGKEILGNAESVYPNSDITKPPRWVGECGLDLKPEWGSCVSSDLQAGLGSPGLEKNSEELCLPYMLVEGRMESSRQGDSGGFSNVVACPWLCHEAREV